MVEITETSEMTALFAVYLALVLAVILLIVSIWCKIYWVAGASGVCWLLCGFYFMAESTSLMVDGLGIICIFAGIGVIATPFITKPKKEVKEKKTYDRVKDIDEELEYYRKARKRV